MTRLLEIMLFLMPFIGFAAWRTVAPSGRMPAGLIAGFGGVVLLLLALLLTLWRFDAADGNRPYVPAQIKDGRVVPGHAGDVVPGHAGDVVPGHAGDNPLDRTENDLPNHAENLPDRDGADRSGKPAP